MTIPATTARESWYGVTGYPTVRIDGSRVEIGGYPAPGCDLMEAIYRSDINARRAETGNVSPIEITGSFYVTGTNSIQMDAKFKLVDPVALTSLRATLLVYEDNVTWCCGYGGNSHWDHNTRWIYDQNITLSGVGSEVDISQLLVLNPAWNPDEMHVVAYVQKTSGNKEIYQGAMLTQILDFSLTYDKYVASVPSGSGPASFHAVLTNIGNSVDTITFEPSVPFGTWVTEFYVGSDPTPHTGPTDIVLNPSESMNILIRVQTDATKEVRSGTLKATSALTLRERTRSLRVYNGSHSVLLVDDDSTFPYEVPLENALTTLGFLFETWDIALEHTTFSPTFSDMVGYDYLIWHTGWRTEAPLTQANMDDLMDYMDSGGALFLSSQSYLNQLGGVPNTFLTNYLGVASWTLDKAYVQLNGVPGDVIGDGLNLPLTFIQPLWKKGDNAVPGATASSVLLAPDGSHAAIRNTMVSGAKSVFMPSAFNGVSETDPDPNNTKVLLDRILNWLAPAVPADVGGSGLVQTGTRITQVRPNPFDPPAEISFMLSAAGASGPVRLEIFDLSGRKVAGLADGMFSPGPHSLAWDGRSDGGTRVGSGVYFARLTTREGDRHEKLIVLK